jgi:hypothetical protein
MKSNFFKSWAILSALAGITALSSCKKILDVQPENVLTREQTYRNVFDADAAVLGVYSKFMNLAKPYVLLNELRADLMSPTVNADRFLQQLNNHTVTTDNPYINPTPFYEVILNCNDVMVNFDKMLADKKLKVDEYSQRYSDVAAIRTWVYLQLGIHFSKDAHGDIGIPYITNPLTTIADLKNESNYKYLPLQQLLNELIKTMEALPTKEIYTTGTTLITTVDQYRTDKFFIYKKVLLGDLYLWRSAFDHLRTTYNQAATYYRQVLSYYDDKGSDLTQKNYWKLIGAPDPATGNQLAVQYVRYRENDVNSLYESNTEGWRSMFSRGKISYDQQFDWEWIWVLPFSSNFSPNNPFIDLFSNIGGSYLVKPSQQAIDNWNSQKQFNGFPYDARGRFTYKTIGGQPVIMKYLYYYMDGNTFIPSINANTRNGEWWLYRAASVWQHFGEAANQDSASKLAFAIVNQGIKNTYTPTVGAPSNVTNIMQTKLNPPYDFDARNGDNPQFRAIWRDMNGFRGRASLPSRGVGDTTNITVVENLLVDEGALELAYEGQRWSDLLRVAIRRNDPSFLADKINSKLTKDNTPGAAEAKAKLVKGDWFLPFKWQ